MSEEKKDFEKTTELTDSELMELINTDYGVRLKLKDVKAGHHLIMKILSPFAVREYDHGGKKVMQYSLKCTYKSPDIDGFVLDVQVGESAAKRLIEKFPNDSYVGSYAFFSKTAYEGLNPQFINPISDYSEPKSKEELFAKKKSATKGKLEEAKPDLSVFDDFKARYLSAVAQSGIKPNVYHMVGSFVGTYEPERLQELIQKCKEALK